MIFIFLEEFKFERDNYFLVQYHFSLFKKKKEKKLRQNRRNLQRAD